MSTKKKAPKAEETAPAPKTAKAKKAAAKAAPKKAAPKKAPTAPETNRFVLSDEQKIGLVIYFAEAKKKGQKVGEAMEGVFDAVKGVKEAPASNLRAYFYAAGERLTIAKNGKTVKLMEHVNGKDKVRAETTK